MKKGGPLKILVSVCLALMLVLALVVTSGCAKETQYKIGYKPVCHSSCA